ncbi:hypothetical protein [Nocardioides sambongensis]|uniref:hypothetical protein n=1 Tax=Nocardioides sambongensis TaxID=2589074 RepID=UPI001128E00F|nr:hypothetical protein [Nocardioides sambongensis]
MSTLRTYEYARLWVPQYDAVSVAVTRPVYLIEADDGFEGFVAEKNTTLIAVLNDLGRHGWRIDTAPRRVATPSPEFQLLIDATLDEVDGLAEGGAHPGPIEPTGGVTEFDVFGMRRRR